MTAHCGDACPFRGCPECPYAGGMWRVDFTAKTDAAPQVEWWSTQAAAEAHEARLRASGVRLCVSWFDAQGTGVPRDLGRQMVREGLQAAIGWLRIDEEGVA